MVSICSAFDVSLTKWLIEKLWKNVQAMEWGWSNDAQANARPRRNPGVRPSGWPSPSVRGEAPKHKSRSRADVQTKCKTKCMTKPKCTRRSTKAQKPKQRQSWCPDQVQDQVQPTHISCGSGSILQPLLLVNIEHHPSTSTRQLCLWSHAYFERSNFVLEMLWGSQKIGWENPTKGFLNNVLNFWWVSKSCLGSIFQAITLLEEY